MCRAGNDHENLNQARIHQNINRYSKPDITEFFLSAGVYLTPDLHSVVVEGQELKLAHTQRRTIYKLFL